MLCSAVLPSEELVSNRGVANRDIPRPRDLGDKRADTFRRNLHPDLRADYVLANPPFNPAKCGTNFAWVQHFIHHLAPHGMAGFVLVRFCFWVKHGCRKIGSREETGHALCAFNEVYGLRPMISRALR